MNNIPESLEETINSLDAFRDFLVSTATGLSTAAKSDGAPVLSKESRDLAIKAAEKIKTSLSQLKLVAAEQTYDHRNEFLLQHVWSAVGWAFLLGQMDGGDPTSGKLQDFSRALQMRESKAAQDKQTKAAQISLIKSTPTFKAKQGHPHMPVDSIHSEINGKFSTSTIRRRLREIGEDPTALDQA